MCAWIGFGGQLARARALLPLRDVRRRGRALYVRELFTIGSGTFSVPVSWLGIIGVAVPVASLGYAYYLRAQNPERYALMGRFVNESAT